VAQPCSRARRGGPRLRRARSAAGDTRFFGGAAADAGFGFTPTIP